MMTGTKVRLVDHLPPDLKTSACDDVAVGVARRSAFDAAVKGVRRSRPSRPTQPTQLSTQSIQPAPPQQPYLRRPVKDPLASRFRVRRECRTEPEPIAANWHPIAPLAFWHTAVAIKASATTSTRSKNRQ